MSFLSLYRKYRPENFQDLIGQDQIKQTLKNALKNDRVAHAYLFAGPRGTGKTSTAKVFAKSLNCSNPSESFEPCGECNSCQRIEKGNSLDVIEIDAASNRGIDEIRELREKVKFYPGEGKYKVYIIDEVHMLTKGAFNALLKTLEEPPESVVFILATTEPHEVITTIMSRCQRFDFTLLSLTNLKKRLEYITESEGYQIDKKALDILARSARGGMRDAISLLDQAISFSDGSLNAEEISKMLGKIDRSALKDFLLFISKKESQKALELLDSELESGVGIERISDELIEYCRELLLIKECGIDSGILEYSQNYLEELALTATNLSSKKITNTIDEFASLKKKLRTSARPRLQLEISIIKLSSKLNSGSLEERLSELEFKLENLLNQGRVETSSVVDEDLKDNSETDFKTVSKEKSPAVNEKQNQNKKQNKSSINKETIVEKEASSSQNKESKSANGVINLTLVKENWAQVLNQTRQLDVSVQALLREGEPSEVKGKTIIVSFPEGKKFHYKGALSNKSLITGVLRKVLNKDLDLEFQLGSKKKEQAELEKDLESKQKKKESLSENETVTKEVEVQLENNSNKNLNIEELARIFSGEIIEVDQSILEKRGGN